MITASFAKSSFQKVSGLSIAQACRKPFVVPEDRDQVPSLVLGEPRPLALRERVVSESADFLRGPFAQQVGE